MPSGSSRPSLRRLLAAVLLLASTGCAHTEVSRVWSDPGLKEDRYRNVMVVVLVPHQGRRRTAEEHIAAELAKDGGKAMRSWDVLPEDALGDRDRIREVVTSHSADAVMTVKVTSVQKEREVSQGREQWVPVSTGIDYYGYVTTSYGLYRKPEMSDRATFTIETALWDVASEKMVWAAQSDTQQRQETITTADIADAYAGVVAKKIRPYLRRK